MRRTKVGKFNQLIASRLSASQASEFLARGRKQNMIARRHAVRILSFVIDIVLWSLLIGLGFLLTRHLLDSGLFGRVRTTEP